MILLNFMILTGLMFCQSNSWQGILPLKTMRSEVEKKLGKPVPESIAKDAAIYQTKNERVLILYSKGPCNSDFSYGWDFRDFTVVIISVYPSVKPKFDVLSVSGRNFKKVPDPEMLDETYYKNETDGVGIRVDTAEGVINSFDYFPAAKDHDSKCK